LAAQKEAAKQAVAAYGLPVDVDPREALLQEVHRTAGHVAWLAELVAGLDHGGVGYRREDTEDGGVVYVPLSGLKQLSRDGKFEKPSVWLEIYTQERRHLREVCRDAIGAGIEERRVELAEQQGAMLVSVIRAILGDLHLSPEQTAMISEVVPRRLRAVAVPKSA
jgi:hypothetical protein